MKIFHNQSRKDTELIIRMWQFLVATLLIDYLH